MARSRSPYFNDVMEIHAAHPEWPAVAIHAELMRRGMDMTHNCVRQIFARAGIQLQRDRGKGKWYDENMSKDGLIVKPIPKRAMPKQPHRASVHSYHGRSRLSPSYTEL